MSARLCNNWYGGCERILGRTSTPAERPLQRLDGPIELIALCNQQRDDVFGRHTNGMIPPWLVNLESTLYNERFMQHRHHNDISDSYHFKRVNSSDVILVFNADHYLMAEYNSRTGRVSWQRVVAASQRDAVERFLQHNYPMKSAPVVAPSVPAPKRKVKK